MSNEQTNSSGITIKIPRYAIYKFNQVCPVIMKGRGNTVAEFEEAFKSAPEKTRKWFPVILRLYADLGAVNITKDDRIFIYWNNSSKLPKNMAWNHFDPSRNTVVADKSNEGIMFSQPIYYKSKDYLQTSFEWTFTVPRIVDHINKYILSSGEQRPTMTSNALF